MSSLKLREEAQLQAALVAATSADQGLQAESCDTAENDSDRVEIWWQRLRLHLDLVSEGDGGRGSDDPAVGPMPRAEQEHTDDQIQSWEAERQALQRERDAEMAAQLAHEEDEDRQVKEDEQRLAQYEAGAYRDWEQWVVLKYSQCSEEAQAGDGSASNLFVPAPGARQGGASDDH